MKKLIEKSVIISALGAPPKIKTEFQIKSDIEKNDSNFRSLLNIVGTTALVFFYYTEENIEKDGYCDVRVRFSSDAMEVKNQIIKEINKFLNQPKEG